ncbi:RNA polymerase sigma factor sigC isoform X2 [Prosopis cineraria]|uniref:RNA polymerase sigma factor sigC isoform X2 n=1 Tax=Prosopis cineraria TaxID=364024 RepID=UPI002410545F|nr:RNA polymerase sigma factor sigC isoform X2 [Prosopis cineraria]
MNFGFRLNLSGCSVPAHSPHSFTSSPIRLSSSSAGGREASFNPTRLSWLSTIYEERETFQNDFRRASSCSSSVLETLHDDCLEDGEIKVNKGKKSLNSVHEMIDNTQMPFGKETFTTSTSFQSFKASHFRLLMENLDVLEETFSDSEVLRLEKDIMMQLGKLGALEFFNSRLSGSFETSRFLDFCDKHPEQVCEHKTNGKADYHLGKVVVRSRRKENKPRRKGALTSSKVLSQPLPSGPIEDGLLGLPASSVKRTLNNRNRRAIVAKKEAEMSTAVKVLIGLERIKAAMEEDTTEVVTLRSWAEAAGVDEKRLWQHLHYGLYCRDELIRSTRSLVLYLAKKYKGMGIASEDLLQAGYVGVLQGAERFDSTRGYKFSTYVQYWIRKSMSRMVARYARGILIPWSLSKAINQIQKAQKSLKSTAMQYSDDYEIAKITGLSVDKIRSAHNCLRVVGSINQKIGDCFSVKYMELVPDASVGSPEEAVMKQQMRKHMHDLLNDLEPREKQVLALRFGLNDHQPRSLEEIGRLFQGRLCRLCPLFQIEVASQSPGEWGHCMILEYTLYRRKPHRQNSSPRESFFRLAGSPFCYTLL